MTSPVSVPVPGPSPVTDADIADLASAGSLLLALDVDGTLAGFSTDPLAVRLVPGSATAVETLRTLPDTTVMLLSGRDLKQLQIITPYGPIAAPGPDDVRLVGSHGAEPAEADADSDGAADVLTMEQKDLLDRVTTLAEEYATREEKLWVEYKPFSRSLHCRGTQNRPLAEAAMAELRAAVGQFEGVHLTDGKDILEIAVTDMTKGRYLEWFIGATDPDKVVFMGDDTTDETALKILRPQDLGVKVGEGETAASRRVADTQEVAEVLLRIAAARQ